MSLLQAYHNTIKNDFIVETVSDGEEDDEDDDEDEESDDEVDWVKSLVLYYTGDKARLGVQNKETLGTDILLSSARTWQAGTP